MAVKMILARGLLHPETLEEIKRTIVYVGTWPCMLQRVDRLGRVGSGHS